MEMTMETSVILLMILSSVAATEGNKRDERDLHPDDKKTIDGIRKQLTALQKSLQDRRCSSVNMEKIGSVYTRWGRTSCPKDTELVYNGRAGGSYYTHKGGAANTLCMPMNPEWDQGKDSINYAHAYIYGAEYQTDNDKSRWRKNYQYEVPCAVCRTKGRPNVYMIPARKTCNTGWQMEYTGYLMADHHRHDSATEYVCMDKDAESVGKKENKNGRLFYHVSARCGSLPCPPYSNGAEMNCVVCSL